MVKRNMIQVSPEFHAKLSSHGRFGERFEDILIRLLGKELEETATGDGASKEIYSADDVDSKKTKLRMSKYGG